METFFKIVLGLSEMCVRAFVETLKALGSFVVQMFTAWLSNRSTKQNEEWRHNRRSPRRRRW